MNNRHLPAVFRRLDAVYGSLREPIVTRMARKKRGPFRVLVGTVLSLRTKDATTAAASRRLFEYAATPREILATSREKISSLIYPVGFYRQKARQLHKICSILIEKHGGRVPATMEELLELPGVGRKTANLVLLKGFNTPAICVDTHVHRITNRWGYVSTPDPDRTELALREKLPGRYWYVINDYLVAYGQNICTPVSPKCSQCTIEKWCEQIGVYKKR